MRQHTTTHAERQATREYRRAKRATTHAEHRSGIEEKRTDSRWMHAERDARRYHRALKDAVPATTEEQQ